MLHFDVALPLLAAPLAVLVGEIDVRMRRKHGRRLLHACTDRLTVPVAARCIDEEDIRRLGERRANGFDEPFLCLQIRRLEHFVLVQHFQQLLDVVEMQAGGRLVQDVERAPRAPA